MSISYHQPKLQQHLPSIQQTTSLRLGLCDHPRWACWHLHARLLAAAPVVAFRTCSSIGCN